MNFSLSHSCLFWGPLVIATQCRPYYRRTEAGHPSVMA